MTLRTRNQQGALHLVAVLAVILVAAAGFVGYKVFTNEEKTKDAATTQTGDNATEPAIEDTVDIDEAAASLEEFDSQLDPSQLDEDLNGLL